MPARIKTAKSKTPPKEEPKPASVQRLPENWPEDVVYLTDHTYSAAVTQEQRSALCRTLSDDATWLRIPAALLKFPNPNVKIPTITDEKHPANGQRGLSAAQALVPDAFIAIYSGHVHTNALSDTNPKSDYDLNLDGEIGLSVDGCASGSESRFANDYRGIAERPNAEFRDCYIEAPSEGRKGGVKWERRVGIFVLSAGRAQGKRRKGIAEGEEVLVSYGKGYWEARKRVASLRKDEVMLQMAQLALDAS